jgi:predicted CXXCH cytochrome family protein
VQPRLFTHAAARLLAPACVLLALGCEREEPAPPAPVPKPAPIAQPPPEFVGEARCAGCHAGEASRWRGSHHDRAMEEASPESVVGNFANARFTRHGVVSELARRDGRFFVRTDGADGRLAEFEIAYTFGVDPLQQYLVAFPGGRLQALGIAWDARPRAQGGARWFHLYGSERTPAGDVLHWTQPSQNWNARCAECHSTNLHKGWDPALNAYATTWSALDVSCEQCHGPGSRHVAWAEAAARGESVPADEPGLGVRFTKSSPADWTFAEGAPIAQRRAPRREHRELETCAPCHARRTTLREGVHPGSPLLDTHRPALLGAGLYEADGQIHDEVYEWGSFLQSRMYAAGVSCGDCHDPHSLALRAEGNALCAQCHRAEVFDTPGHHHHAQGSRGAACASCHMPERTYMQIDVRHDHSFRVPRPDLSVEIGTPNTCNGCHRDRNAAWAAKSVAAWFPDGRSGAPHYARALHAGREGRPGADELLRGVIDDSAQPAIVRASALAQLAAMPSPDAMAAARRGLQDQDPLVRLGALEAIESDEPRARLAAVDPLLRDPVRAVRIEAALLLADAPADLLAAGSRQARAAGLAEYRAAQELGADGPEAHVNLGILALRQGDADGARREYETALRLGPWFVPAYVNLADLERAQGREAEAEPLLRRALEMAPESAEVHYALGLWLVRNQRRAEAIRELERAARLAPRNQRFALAAKLAREQP